MRFSEINMLGGVEWSGGGINMSEHAKLLFSQEKIKLNRRRGGRE